MSTTVAPSANGTPAEFVIIVGSFGRHAGRAGGERREEGFGQGEDMADLRSPRAHIVLGRIGFFDYFVLGATLGLYASVRPLVVDVRHALSLQSERDGRALLAGLRLLLESDILTRGKKLRLWANVRKSRADRGRDQKLFKMAEAVQAALNDGHKKNVFLLGK